MLKIDGAAVLAGVCFIKNRGELAGIELRKQALQVLVEPVQAERDKTLEVVGIVKAVAGALDYLQPLGLLGALVDFVGIVYRHQFVSAAVDDEQRAVQAGGGSA